SNARPLVCTGNGLSLGGGDSFALSGTHAPDTTLCLTDNTLDLEDGGAVDLGKYLDNTDSQTLELTGTDLAISGGNTIDISGINTDEQTLSLNVNTLELENGGTVDLGKYLDNTDEQTLTLTGTNLEISGGNTIDISGVNTDDQALSLTGNTLALEDGGSVDLGIYLDNTDDQDASEVNLDNPVDVDGDSTNEGTVEQVIQAIAPITSKAARIFYPPSIAIDA